VRVLGGCVRLLAAHTLPVAHLRMWLAVAAGAAGGARGVLLDNLDAALRLSQSRGPAAAFQLDGESSGLLGVSTPGHWPFNDQGFTFVTWMYLESLSGSETAAAAAAAIAAAAATAVGGGEGSKVARVSVPPSAAAAAAAAAAAGDKEAHMPRLFSFLSTEESGRQGVEAYYHGQFLVLEANGSKGQRVSVPFTRPFKLKRWTCVAVEYAPAAASSATAAAAASSSHGGGGEMRLYVDGIPTESRRVSLPTVKGSLGFCCVGTNPPAAMAGLQRRRRQCALFGALGPVYIFQEAIGAARVAQLAARGGSYVPSYGVSPPAEESGGGRGGVGGGVSGSDDRGSSANIVRGAGGKKIAAAGARGFQLAGAAAKAVAKAAAGGTPRGGQFSSSANSSASKRATTSGAHEDGGGGGGEGGGSLSHAAAASASSLTAAAAAAWTALDADLAPALLQLLHPAAVAPSGPASRRVPDMSPAGLGGRGERYGSALGGTHVILRSLLRDALWAVAPGGPASLLPLACPALCARSFQPRRLRGLGEERSRRVAAAAASLRPVISIMARSGDTRAHVASLDALAAADAPRLLAHVLPAALDAMRRAHDGGRAWGAFAGGRTSGAEAGAGANARTRPGTEGRTSRDGAGLGAGATGAQTRQAPSSIGVTAEGSSSSADRGFPLDSDRQLSTSQPISGGGSGGCDGSGSRDRCWGGGGGGRRVGARSGEGRWDCLDAAEVAVVEALERLLRVARHHPPLRRQLCTHLFLSLEPWVGGGGGGTRDRERNHSSGGGGGGGGTHPGVGDDDGGETAEGAEGGLGVSVGLGVPALRCMLRATAALAHAEGGVALRQLCGLQRYAPNPKP
jgi:hypothetical protein